MPQDAEAIAKTTSGALTAHDFMKLPAYGAYLSTLVEGAACPGDPSELGHCQQPFVTRLKLAWASSERYGRPLAEVEHELLLRAGFRASDPDEAFGRSGLAGAS